MTSSSASSVRTGLDYVGLRVIDRLTCKAVTCCVGDGLVDTWDCIHLYAVPV